MAEHEKVNILLVDDQPGKLMSYEVILKDLNENLIKANSAREAFTHLLKNDIAVVLIDVVMPEMDGFQLAAMIREHPRYKETAIIFISAVQLADQDRVRGYQMGAVDYVPVPVVPEVLRAKVKVFCELFRKTRQLEALNRDLETRVKDRTQALEKSNALLVESERRRSLALTAGKMGSWAWDLGQSTVSPDEGQYRMFGFEPGPPTLAADFAQTRFRDLIEPEDLIALTAAFHALAADGGTQQTEFRVRRNGETRWCLVSATAERDDEGSVVRLAGVTLDITERKRAEETQLLLAKEVDHRARNTLAVVQAVLRMTRARSIEDYVGAVEGRISALARAHGLLSQSRWQGADLAQLIHDELAPYKTSGGDRRVAISGSTVLLAPATAQTIAIALHELATNAAKYGALARDGGTLSVAWAKKDGRLILSWNESGLSGVKPPTSRGFGTTVIRASVQEQLRGALKLDWRAEGLQCVIEVPDHAALSRTVEREHAANGKAEQTNSRVLLAEDEALVALMMRDALNEAGHEVMGPFASVVDALAALQTEKPDCAILDVNLIDGSVYPLAVALANAGVPFIFASGYDRRSIDERFKNVPVLQKPVDRENLMALLPQTRPVRQTAPA